MITPYCQTDNRWRDVKIGRTHLTIGGYGCYLTCISMLDGHSPLVVNEIFTEDGVYVDGDNIPDTNYLDDYLIDGFKAAKVLGRTYQKVTVKPKVLCIAETNYYKKLGNPQHFFVWSPDGKHTDPLTGGKPLHDYPVVSWRLFNVKNIA